MEFAVLGPLEVGAEGRPVPVGGPRQRALLTLLLLRAGEVVPVGRVIDGIWGDRLPRDPTAAVEVAASRLRTALGADAGAGRLVWVAGGYRLRVEPEELDLRRFEVLAADGRAAAASGRHEHASQLFSRALALWRGPPLEEFADIPLGRRADWLVELRLSAEEARIDAELACGRHAETVARLRRLLDEEPWRERLHGQLMVALVRAGRTGDAVAAFEAYRAAVRRELASEPGAELRRLHERVLDQDPSLLGVGEGHRASLGDARAAAATPQATAAAVDHATAAGDRAQAGNAPGEAVAWFRRALELHDTLPGAEERRRCELLVALGDALHLAGDRSHRGVLLNAAALARRLGEPALEVRAALASDSIHKSAGPVTDEPRVAMLTSALAASGGGDSPERARLLAVLAAELALDRDPARRRRLSDEAVAMAERVGEPATLAHVLASRAFTIAGPDTLDVRVADACRFVKVASLLGDPGLRLTAAWCRVVTALEAGDLTSLDRHFGEAVGLAEASNQPRHVWGALLHSSWRAVLAGDLGDAERRCHAAHALGQQVDRDEAGVVYTAQLLCLRWAQDRLDELVDVLAPMAAATPELAFGRAALAAAHCEARRPALARPVLADDVATGFASVARDFLWLPTLVLAAQAVVALDDPVAMPRLLELLAPWEHQWAFTTSGVLGPVAHTLGTLHAACGRPDEARRSLALAVQRSEAMAAPLFADRARAALALLPTT